MMTMASEAPIDTLWENEESVSAKMGRDWG